MNVLVLGSGAREHALAWKLRQSRMLDDLFVAPGNAGTAAIATNLDLSPNDFDAVIAAARAHSAGLVVVGPEDPLVAGIADALRAADLAVYGPTAAAARIEGSKVFAKALMQRAGVPSAAFEPFDDAAAARAFAARWTDARGVPPVVKADGLAAGKGVTVAATLEEAEQAIDQAMLGRAFGDAGTRLVLEERMTGVETSAHAFCDGATAVQMAYACDYKRVDDGDQGPNTGGMGVYSPPSFVDDGMRALVQRAVIEPTLAALADAGAPYTGTLYPGLMVAGESVKVVEFNCRFGDPETQALMMRLESDLLDILLACTTGSLAGLEIRWSDAAAVGVVMASGGYPGTYRTGVPVHGLDELPDGVQVFHAGTRREGGEVVTTGGRVLTVCATGSTLAAARARAYQGVAGIWFEGAHYRTDIALHERRP